MRSGVLALLLALGGCGLLTASRDGRMLTEDLHALHVGLDADLLRDRIGAPDDVTDEPDGSERWTYVYGSRDAGDPHALVVHVRDGEVRTWEERPAD